MRLILDLDGVIYRGEEALPHAGAFFGLLHRRGIPFVLVTNNSTRSPEAVVDKLRSMGIRVSASQVLTSAEVTAVHVQRRFPGARVYAVGEEGLRRALTGRGCTLMRDEEALGEREGEGGAGDASRTGAPGAGAPNGAPGGSPPGCVVVVGLDTQVTYRTLSCAAAALQRGAAFIATNRDATFPLSGGRIAPGSGALIAALEVTTGVPATVMGKPELPIFEEALAVLDRMTGGRADRDTCWVVGDRLDTDILGAHRARLCSALLLTGVTGEDEVFSAAAPPDLIAADLRDLALRLLRTEIGEIGDEI